MPRHDTPLGRKPTRSPRETGCRVYVPAEILELAEIDPSTVLDRRYRFWPGKRGRIIVQFEKAKR